MKRKHILYWRSNSTQINYFIDERVKTTTDIVIKINKLSYNKTDTTITSSSAIAEGPRDAFLKSVEILSAAAQLYKKSHLTIVLSCGIKISPVGSLD